MPDREKLEGQALIRRSLAKVSNKQKTIYTCLRKLTNRHFKSGYHVTIGHQNILRLQKDKGWHTVEYVDLLALIL